MANIRRYMAPTTRASRGTNSRTYITIHETANTARGANANVHARLQAGVNPRLASWHYQVDDKEIVQSFEDTVRCWHAGTTANNHSIAIEICVNSDGDYNKAFANAAKLVAILRKRHGIPWNRVVSHNFWTGKNCPTKLLASGRWDEFIAKSNPSKIGKIISAVTPKQKVTKKSGGIVYTTIRNAPIYVNRGKNKRLDPKQPVAHNYRLSRIKTAGSWTQVMWKGNKRWIATAHVSTKKSSLIMYTNIARAPIYINRGADKKLDPKQPVVKGYALALVKRAGSWAQVRWKGNNRWIAWEHLSEKR